MFSERKNLNEKKFEELKSKIDVLDNNPGAGEHEVDPELDQELCDNVDDEWPEEVERMVRTNDDHAPPSFW